MRTKTVVIFLLLSAAIAGAVYLTLSSRPPKFNLIIVSIDGLRPDRLGAYGCETVNSPNLDSFARSAYVFENAISQSPRILPSHLSLFTSLYLSTHQVSRPDLTLHPDIPTLAEILKRNGRRTAAVVDSAAMAWPSGISRGFDFFYNKKGAGIRDVLPLGRRWLRDNARHPFFLFLQVSDIRCPYQTLSHLLPLYDPGDRGKIDWSDLCGNHDSLPRDRPAGQLGRVRRLYDGAVRSTDLILQSLFDQIDELELRRDTIVVVLAGAGEEIGEHGRIGHRDSVYHELLRVPLIVRLPGDLPPAGRIPERVELIDLLPTLLDLLGIDPPPELQGRSLSPLLEGRTEAWTAKPAFGELSGSNGKRTVYRGDFQYIFNAAVKSAELYRIDRDPGETHNLAEEESAAAREAAALLADWKERAEKAGAMIRAGALTLDQRQRGMLKNLGYIE